MSKPARTAQPFLAALAFAGAFALAACSTDDVTDPVTDNVPTKAEIDDAKARVGLSSDALGRVHAVLEMLGLIPRYECGEPRATFAGKLPDRLRTSFTGSVVSLDATDPASDKVSLAFPASGTTVHGLKLTGNLLVKTSGGTDRFTLELDARNAQVNGRALQALGGYGTCGDSTSYWADSEGPLSAAARHVLKAQVGKKSGLPVIGKTNLLINAEGKVTSGGKDDGLVLTAVDYEVGKVLPKSGSILITTSSGRRIHATFSDDTPLLNQVKVKVDDKSAVLIPLPDF